MRTSQNSPMHHMYNSNTPLNHDNSNFNTSRMVNNYPRNQQWSLIYKQSARETQLLSMAQKQHQWQQKRKVKEQLDRQVAQRQLWKNVDKSTDQRYKSFIDDKIKREAEKQKMEQNRRRQMRKIMEQNNKELLKLKQLNKLKGQIISRQSNQPAYYQQQQHDQKMIKSQQLSNSRTNNLNTHLNIHRNPYFQTPKVNKVQVMYAQLAKQQILKKKQQQQKVYRDFLLNRQKQYYKIVEQDRRKSLERDQMKKVLHDQMVDNNIRVLNQRKINPQDDAYTVFGKLNREDKKKKPDLQYAKFLQMQLQQQQARKERSKYMTEEEMKFNMNQLNKAVTGQYAHQNYQDRTMVNGIGQRLRRYTNEGNLQQIMSHNHQPIYAQGDEEAVRRKIQQLNYRRRSSRLDNEKNM